jgi:hypothetical protein
MYSILGAVSIVLLVAVIIDQAYQRLSHKWTNEPPLLPYRIPIIGHALMFTSNRFKLFKAGLCVVPNFLKSCLLRIDSNMLVVNAFPIADPTRSCFLANESTYVHISYYGYFSMQMTVRSGLHTNQRRHCRLPQIKRAPLSPPYRESLRVCVGHFTRRHETTHGSGRNRR